MPENQLSVVPQQSAELTIAGMLQAVIGQGVTETNVAALDKLCGLYERMQVKTAEQDFTKAFVALQSDIPAVQACKVVPNRDGTPRYKFAPYEEIMRQVQPLLQKHGFSVTFNMSFSEGRIKSICTLMHTSGHSRSNEFAVRIGGGPPGSNEMQADGAAKTYAKRGALCDALNIVVEQDTDGDDGRGLGKTITLEQAADLKRRVKATKADEKKFLAFAGATSYEEITESKLELLDDMLTKREKKAAETSAGDEKDAEGNYTW